MLGINFHEKDIWFYIKFIIFSISRYVLEHLFSCFIVAPKNTPKTNIIGRQKI